MEADEKYSRLKFIFKQYINGSANIKRISKIEKMISLSNRETRILISKLKKEIPIVSLSGMKDVDNLKGYFYFDGDKKDIKYLQHCKNEYISRIKDYEKTIKVLSKAEKRIHKEEMEQARLFP